MAALFWITLVLFVIVCIFMILLVLIQKGRGGGLASAFGGSGGNTAFGSKTGDVLTWATSIVFLVFLLLGVAMNLISSSLDDKAKTPAATVTFGGSGGGPGGNTPTGAPAGPGPAAPAD